MNMKLIIGFILISTTLLSCDVKISTDAPNQRYP